MEGESRELSDAGVVRQRVGRDGAQGQGLAPGVGAGGDAVVDGGAECCFSLSLVESSRFLTGVHADPRATGPRVAHRRGPGAVSGDEARAARSARVAGSSTHQGGPDTRTP